MCKLHLNVKEKIRRDPTRTATVRKAFESEAARRFRDISADAREFLLSEQFEFLNDREKIPAFMQYLNELQGEHLQIQPGAYNLSAQDTWAGTYIERAYNTGVQQAASQLRKGGAEVASEWAIRAMTRPIHADRMGIIFTRSYTDLQGITAEMDKQISRILAEGIAQGVSPLAMARQMHDRVEKIGITRAKMLARTEVINAHAEAALNTYLEAGLEGVEVEPEWLHTASACDICSTMAKKSYTLSEARGLIPFHPNCRCAWKPKIVNGTGIILR